MRIVQLLLAGLLAVFAVLAVFFAAALVFVGAIVGSVLRIFTGQPKAPRPSAARAQPNRARVIRADDAIEVETSVIRDDSSR